MYIGVQIIYTLHYSSSSTVATHRESSKMGNSFRMQPRPTLYGEEKTPVTEDLLQVGLLVAFGIIAFSFILIIPGIRGAEVRIAGEYLL